MNELKIIDEREVLGKQLRIYGDFENPLFFTDICRAHHGLYGLSTSGFGMLFIFFPELYSAERKAFFGFCRPYGTVGILDENPSSLF